MRSARSSRYRQTRSEPSRPSGGNPTADPDRTTRKPRPRHGRLRVAGAREHPEDHRIANSPPELPHGAAASAGTRGGTSGDGSEYWSMLTDNIPVPPWRVEAVESIPVLREVSCEISIVTLYPSVVHTQSGAVANVLIIG